MTKVGTPIIMRYAGLHYFPNEKSAEELAEAIRTAASKIISKPAFITVFVVPDAKDNVSAQDGFCPADFARVMEILGEKEYKAVSLAEMAWATKQYASKYPDRVNKPQSRERQGRIGVNVIRDEEQKAGE